MILLMKLFYARINKLEETFKKRKNKSSSANADAKAEVNNVKTCC